MKLVKKYISLFLALAVMLMCCLTLCACNTQKKEIDTDAVAQAAVSAALPIVNVLQAEKNNNVECSDEPESETFNEFVDNLKIEVEKQSEQHSCPDIHNDDVLKDVCTCGYNMIGDYYNGSVTITLNGEEHTHAWAELSYAEDIYASVSCKTNSNIDENIKSEETNDIVAVPAPKCTECYFFMYAINGQGIIRINCGQNNNRTHTVIFDLKKYEPLKDVCTCGYNMVGDYYNGSVTITLNGEEHTHIWATQTNLIGCTNDVNSNIENDSNTSKIVAVPAPKCTECYFFKYAINGQGIIRINCGQSNKTHTVVFDLNTYNKILPSKENYKLQN